MGLARMQNEVALGSPCTHLQCNQIGRNTVPVGLRHSNRHSDRKVRERKVLALQLGFHTCGTDYRRKILGSSRRGFVKSHKWHCFHMDLDHMDHVAPRSRE